MARTQAQRKAETRGRLLSAAADLFAREGFHGTSTDAVADAADRTSGALYAHFGDKHGLLLALLDEMTDATSRVIRADLEQATSARERLSVLWRDFADPPEQLGATWLLLEHELWLWAARNPNDADRLAKRYARERGALAEGIGSGVFGEASRRDPEHSAVLVLALLLGLEMQRRIDPDAVPDDLAVEGLLALLTRQAAPPASGDGAHDLGPGRVPTHDPDGRGAARAPKHRRTAHAAQ